VGGVRTKWIYPIGTGIDASFKPVDFLAGDKKGEGVPLKKPKA
jgi:hypothetical protein